MFYEISSLIGVALLWGATNPLIKRGSKDIVHVKADNKLMQFVLELKYLFTNINYIIPMGLNQCGSVLYFVTLQNLELSLAVPVANSLSFVFTALMEWHLSRVWPSRNTNLGVCLILMGSFMNCYDKYLQKELNSF